MEICLRATPECYTHVYGVIIIIIIINIFNAA